MKDIHILGKPLDDPWSYESFKVAFKKNKYFNKRGNICCRHTAQIYYYSHHTFEDMELTLNKDNNQYFTLNDNWFTENFPEFFEIQKGIKYLKLEEMIQFFSKMIN